MISAKERDVLGQYVVWNRILNSSIDVISKQGYGCGGCGGCGYISPAREGCGYCGCGGCSGCS